MDTNPYAMSAWALFIIGIVTKRRGGGGAAGLGNGRSATIAFQPPNTVPAQTWTRDSSTSPTTTATSWLGPNRALWRARRRSRVSASTDSSDPLIGRPYG